MKSNNVLLKQGGGAFAGMVLSQQYGETIVREHIKRNTSDSPRQQSHRRQWAGWAVSWANLTQAQIAGFTRLAALVTAKEGRKRPLSNYALYARLNEGLASVNGDTPIADAPLQIEVPDTAGDITLAVSYVAGVLKMHVVSPTGCGDPCQVWACEYFAPGRNKARENQMRQIGWVSGVLAGGLGIDISEMYAAAFGPVPVGQKVAVRLVPVSASGFQSTSPSTAISVCKATALELEETGPETEDDGAALAAA